jgi:hypothetical protein
MINKKQTRTSEEYIPRILHQAGCLSFLSCLLSVYDFENAKTSLLSAPQMLLCRMYVVNLAQVIEFVMMIVSTLDLCLCVFYLFAVYLSTIFRWRRLYTVEWNGDKWMIKWKGLDGSCRGLILRHYSGVCLEIQRNTTKNLSQDIRSPGRDLNAGYCRHEARMLTTTFGV